MGLFSFRKSSGTSSSSQPLTGERSIKRNRSFLGKFRRCGRKPSSGGKTSNQSWKETSRELPSYQRRSIDFFGFCDTRIATVLLNVLHMCMSIIAELFKVAEYPNYSFVSDPPILMFLAVGTSGLGMLGALHFALCGILLSSMGMCFLWYLYVMEAHVFGCILLGLVWLAQIALAIEMSLGIMTPETYAMEEYMDRDGRKALEKVHGLTVDIHETAVEFADEVVIEVKRQSSGFSRREQESQEREQESQEIQRQLPKEEC